MEVLVTGAHGFLGTHLVKRLQKAGHKVHILSREQLESGKKINKNPDYIFHLASYGQHIQQRDGVDEIYKTIIFKLLNLLKATNHINYKAFINIGTSSEYGLKDKPMKETDLLEPDFFYASAKAAATLLCQAWSKQHNKPIITVRPFSLYGPGEAEFRFIPKLLKSSISNEVFYLNPGVHDWVYIQDFIDALFIIIKNAKKLKGKVINVGTGKQYTNVEVAKILQKYVGQLKIMKGRSRPNDTIGNWRANNKLIKSLGWKPKHSLEEGLTETLSYYLPGI